MRIDLEHDLDRYDAAAELRRIRQQYKDGVVDVYRGKLKICQFVTQVCKPDDTETRFCFITDEAKQQNLVSLPWAA